VAVGGVASRAEATSSRDLTARRLGFLVWAGLLFVFAVAFKPVVENDGAYYFTYLHAVLVDHTFNASTELPHVYTSSTDLFPIGSAILSAPAYLVALAIGGAGRPAFDAIYTTPYVLASLLYGLLALAIAHRMALRLTGSTGAAAAGVAAGALATPFAYYLLYEPSYSHTFSAFATAAFLYYWWRNPDRSALGWIWLGALGGLMADVRFQDGLLLLIALLDVRRARWRVLLMVPTAALVFAPQALVDLAQWGTLWPHRSAAQALAAFPGHYLQVLFSSHNGLFVWHPALLAAAAGFFFVRDRRLVAAAALAFLIETAIDGMLPDWPGGFAFGGRRFVALTPFFILGFAALATQLKPRVVWLATAALAAWNLLLAANLTYVIVSSRDPGYAGLVAGQVQAVLYVGRELVQGQVVRDLVLWPVLRTPFAPGRGLLLLALEAVCAAIFAIVFVRARLPLSEALTRPAPAPHPAATPTLEAVEIPAATVP
jgi:hypothetical protein